jgi:hypothetical protein
MKQGYETNQEPTPCEGRYANHFQVGHNFHEFVIDFGQLYADNDKPRFHTRIVVTPIYAKALLSVLQKSIDQYERLHRNIPREC